LTTCSGAKRPLRRRVAVQAAARDQAWDLWFDLAQAHNGDDPPYTHGVFQLACLTPGPHTGSPPQLPSEP
jgi:hypothetical protein